jgi:hypothetical protein
MIFLVIRNYQYLNNCREASDQFITDFLFFFPQNKGYKNQLSCVYDSNGFSL